jgi:hypothetical protein
MGSTGPFGFDPDDIDRVVREAGQNLRDTVGKAGRFLQSGDRAVWSALADQFARGTRTGPEPKTTGDTGDGVWAIYTLDADGTAHVEQVYATELEALRAHKHNTDARRRVRFLPYGVTVSILDAPAG